jgi:aminopeptidase N
LWLNEGFATLYANHLTSVVYPTERWIDTFLIDTVQPVMENDANPSIRPMTYYVESPERIDNLFDNVAYSKGMNMA